MGRRGGLWFAKIILLATHPLALHQHPEINKHRIIGEWETEDFSWLIEGTPPPSDLSLWVFRAEQEEGTPTARVLLPKVVQLDDGTTPFPMTMITLEGICLTLVYHPGWASIIPWSLRAQLGSSSTTLPKAISPTSRSCRSAPSTGVDQTPSCSRTGFASTAHSRPWEPSPTPPSPAAS